MDEGYLAQQRYGVLDVSRYGFLLMVKIHVVQIKFYVKLTIINVSSNGYIQICVHKH